MRMTLLAWLTLGTAVALCMPGVQAAQPERGTDGRGLRVGLRVDPWTGEVRELGARSRDLIDASFDLVSVDCPDCGDTCPPVTRTVVVVLEALTDVAGGYGVSDLTDSNYTVSGVGYSTQAPLSAGQQVTITLTGDVLECGSWFNVWFSVCDVAPADWHTACPRCPEAPLTLTRLHSFGGGASDGREPPDSLVLDGAALYGMTYYGGASNLGVVFSMGTDGSGFQVLHTFVGGTDDGQYPNGSLVLGGATLYGMTFTGGASNRGVVFSLATNGSGFQILHDFASGAGNGSWPYGSLTLDGATLYGMTSSGGAAGLGAVFSIGTDGSGFQVIHSFAGGAGDGRFPEGSLTLDGATLYGMTRFGGASDLGVVFSMAMDGGGFQTIHEFAGGVDDGAAPYGSVTVNGGTLYGMAPDGGDEDRGVVFSIGTGGSGFQLLHEFGGGAGDGDDPYFCRLVACGSTLYGTTRYGGASNYGVVFSVDKDGGGFQVLEELNGFAEGRYPYGSLTADGATLYGMTRYGGNSSWGVVFKLE